MIFSPFEPDRPQGQRRRFRAIPVRTLLPNVITLLALCAGLTAIRLATEQKFELALAAVVFAASITSSEFNNVNDCGAVVLRPRSGQLRLLSGASKTSRNGNRKLRRAKM